jgi:outer membrane immunogenic protein
VLATSSAYADGPYGRSVKDCCAPSWTGFYFGVNVGEKWGRFDEIVSTPGLAAPIVVAPDSIRFRGSDGSFAGGFQAGYQKQVGSVVAGVEVDWDWTRLKVRHVATTGGDVLIPGDIFTASSDWESSFRLKLGHTWDRWLIYATTGVALAHVRASATFIPTVVGAVPFPASAGSDSRTVVGGTIGAGLAYQISRNWDVGVEYRYTDYRRETFSLGTVAAVCPAPCTFVPATGRVDLNTNEALVKLNYRFN